MKSNRVLIFIDKISYSGASKIVCWVSNGLLRAGIDVTLVTHQKQDAARMLDSRVHCIQLEVGQGNRISRGLRSIAKLRKLIKSGDYGLCIGFLPTECFYMRVATAFLGVPMIVCERSDPYLERGLIADIGRFSYRFADGAVFQTEGAKNFFPLSLQKRSVVIPNPAFQNKTAMIPYAQRGDTIAYSGRLHIRQKRQDVLLRAFSQVCKTNDSVQLVLYGDGPDRQELKRLAINLHIDGRVHFAGRINNVEEAISSSKLLVLSSDYEGIPNVILEALQMGVPVVSTDCSPGGAALLIQNGVNGFLAKRDSVADLADKIQQVLDNTELAAQMAAHAPQITQRFREEDVLNEWIQYIETFLPER